MKGGRAVKDYRERSIHYLENALVLLQEGELEKGSEFLWGGMAEAIKAVAARKGVILKSHEELWHYASGLARELRDESLFDAFHHASSLHSNFYEARLPLEDVLRLASRVKTAIRKLLGLASVEDLA